MKFLNFSGTDIRLHLKRNRGIYFAFMMFFLIGVFIAIIVVSSNESYLSLMTSKNKTLYSYINGTANISELFWNQIFKFLVPLILLFLLGLNFYSSLISFIFITYQSTIFVMSASAIISLYGLSGILNFLLIMLPVNLIYFAGLIFFSITVIARARQANIQRNFAYGFDREFLLKVLAVVIFVILLSAISSLIYPLFLKSAIFMFF